MGMKEKIQQAIKEMGLKVSRDNRHVYRDENGVKLQGVSSVSSIIPKDWLSAWGAKEAVKALGYSDYPETSFAEEMWEKIKNCSSVKEYLKILSEAKGASRRKSGQALIDGKKGHEWIEKYIEARLMNQNPPEIPMTDLLERPIKQFLEWEKQEVQYWIASEALVYRPDKMYAGQLDAIYMSQSNKLTLVDFKFASGISEDYYLQTAGYAAAFEPYGIIFDQRAIVRLPKTLERDEWNDQLFKYEKQPNNLEFKIIPTPYEFDREAFFHALPLKQWVNAMLKVGSKE